MVRVDMNPTRKILAKRLKRRRRLAHRRLQNAQRQQQGEILAALAARESRRLSVANWAAAERKREEQEKTAGESPKKTVVRFANDVMVTEIPVDAGGKLPEPFASPIGVAIANKPALRDQEKVTPVRFVTVNDDWTDGSDEDDDPEFLPEADVDIGEASGSGDATVMRRIRPSTVTSDDRHSANGVASEDHITARMRKSKGKSSTEGKRSFPLDTNPKAKARKQAHGNSTNGPVSAVAPKLSSESKASASERAPVDSSSINSPENERKAKKSKKRKKCDESSILTSQFANGTKSSSHSAGNSETPPHLTSDADTPPNQSAVPSKRRKKKKRKVSRGVAELQVSPSSPVSSSASKKSNEYTNGFDASSPPTSDGSLACENGSSDDKAADDDMDIENMFVDLVKQRAAQKATKAAKAQENAQMDQASDKVKSNPPTKKARNGATRYTEDGLRIVSYDDLADDQPKGLNGPCPFECPCCF